MSQPSLTDDLAFVRQMAEEGAAAPSLSGRFSLWWGSVTAFGALCHWAILRGVIPAEPQSMWILWIAIGVIGIAGSAFLRRGMADKPGQSSVGNRADAGFWAIAGMGMLVYWLAIVVAVVVRGQPPLLFDTMFPVGFFLYAVSSGVAATLQHQPSRQRLAFVSLGFAGVCLAFAGSPDIYLVAAIGMLIAYIVPGLAALRAEPKAIV